MNKALAAIFVTLAAGLHPARAAATRTLPQSVGGQLHRGRKLNKVWVAPTFDPARGFRASRVVLVPEVTHINGPYLADRFTVSLTRLADPASGNVLDLTITELTTRERAITFSSSVTLEVEGLVQADDGTPLAAFATRLEENGSATLAGNCRDAADRVVAELAGELGMHLKRWSELKPASHPVPAQPPASLAATPPTAPAPAAIPAIAPAPATPAKRTEPEDPKPRGQHF